MVRVLVVGDIVTDVLAVLRAPLATGSDTPADVRFTGGGAAANTAAWLASVGVEVTLVAAVGVDAAGDARLAELTAAGVRLAVRRCPDAPTGTVVVLADSSERTMLFDRGANLLLAPSDVDAALASSGARHLHLSGYTLLHERSRPAGRHALAAARERGLTTSVDAASAEPLRHATGFLDWVRGTDVLLANVDEARVLASPLTAAADGTAADLAGTLAAAGIGAVVVKHGRAGSVLATGSGPVVTAPAEDVTAVDSTGAGDAFAAGFLSAWLSGADPQAALRAGAHLGARAVTTVGARPTTVGRPSSGPGEGPLGGR